MSKTDINHLIELHDETLNTLRDEWLNAKDEKTKNQAMNRIDRALDYRLKLMSERERNKDDSGEKNT